MAEIQVHGSKAVIDALHTNISKIKNCRLAEPGEFTKACISKWQNKFT